MSQTIAVQPAKVGWRLCFYVNQTSQIQVVRIRDTADWYSERVVFPRQCLLFEAPPEAKLEIYQGRMEHLISSDSVRYVQAAAETDGTETDGSR